MTALSIVIPFFRDDPCALLEDLASCTLTQTEICLRDDGSGDAALLERVQAVARAHGSHVRVSAAPHNEGRSAARNALIADAKAPHVLFLDADMRLPDDRFLERWHEAIAVRPGSIQFGGFQPAEAEPKSLHAAMAATSDCPAADRRNRAPSRYVYTSNLLVPRTVLKDVPFATDFVGWGWEDVEWAIRASAVSTIHHLDNPAIHDDFIDDRKLLERFATSSANFARLVALHPAIASQMPVYKVAQLFRNAPLARALTPAFAQVALAGGLPMSARVLAVKLWRASHYGKALAS